MADPSINSLNHIRHEYKAGDGENGGGNGCYGVKGQDVTFSVPLGTLIYKIAPDGSKTLIDECSEEFSKIVLSKGGKGGRGNRALRTNNHQYEKGLIGEENQVELDMNTIADIGLVGQPNAGKSSILACLSRSSPKIAPYPFTTLAPNIGVVIFDDGHALSVADVPGLIEGAHQNMGLGHEFLKHVRKSQKLILVLDCSLSDPLRDALSVKKELELYQKGLADRIFLIIANKVDRIIEPHKTINEIEKRFPTTKVVATSAKFKQGIEEVKDYIRHFINKRN
jgi:GTP-binding protein